MMSLAMTAPFARHLACILATTSIVGSGACSFEALGQGGGPGELMPTTTDSVATGSSSSSPGSGEIGSTDASSGDADGTSEAPSSESGVDGTDTGGRPPFPSGPFDTPVPVDVVNIGGQTEDDPALSPDGLELYFETDRDGGYGKIWIARRPSVDDPWGEPELVPGIGAEFSFDGTPGLTGDGLRMFFISNRPGSFGNDVYVTRRAELHLPWGGPQRVDALSSTWDDLGPRPVPGGEGGLFLCSDRLTAMSVGQHDLWLFEQTDFETGTYSEPVIVSALSSPSYDCMLMMAESRLEVFFDSDRQPSVGSQDIWSAVREDENAELGVAFPVDSLNGNAEDRDPFLSPDGHELYFASNRSGSMDIWVARR
jgi:hypothetical protein